MIIAICNLDINVPTAGSLKDKRRVIKSMITRMQNRFNIAVAEVEHLDSWQTAGLGIVTVSNDAAYAHGLLTKVINWIEETRLDCELIDYSIELIN